MRVKYDTLLIIDVEATCWERGTAPPEQTNEVIEVGICVFDLSFWKPTEKDQIIVTPTQSDVSKYCTDLTGYTLPYLKAKGVSFHEACRQLRDKFESKTRVWGSWGDYDRVQFERECRRKDVIYPFSSTHFNLKALFSIHNQMKKGIGMKRALEKSKLRLEGLHHIGMDDAYNTGRILEAQGRF